MVLNIFKIIDISFLALALILLVFFLRKNKKRLKKEGMMYLYKTSWGIKLINKIGKRYSKALHFLSYVSIFLGYILMAGILYLLGSTAFQYLTKPEIIATIRAPPIAPIIPYFPELFGLSDFFPPLYAIYFIIAILIVATVHEFSHGIFARKWGVRIKTTGFVFLRFFPVVFGAFVEQDDKQMAKKSKFKQMSILSAGVFANIISAIIFFFALILFFHVAFAPSGIAFASYPYTAVDLSKITEVNGVEVENPNLNEILILTNDTGLNRIKSGENGYVIKKENLESQKDGEKVILYYDAPAINMDLERVIVKIDGRDIEEISDIKEEISKHSPGEKVTLTVLSNDGKDYDRDIILGKNPEDKNSPWLGIGFSSQENKFVKSEFIHFMNAFRTNNLNFINNTYYKPLMGDLSGFLYYLIWWVVLINILVGLFNMLPFGILDGGRFFYLTILGLTKSEKTASIVYRFSGYLILFVLALLMFRWVFSFF